MDSWCDQCGKCCKDRTLKDVWKKGKYDENFKPNDRTDSCQAYEEVDGKGVCMLHKLYGYDAKPDDCRTFTEKDCKKFLVDRITNIKRKGGR